MATTDTQTTRSRPAGLPPTVTRGGETSEQYVESQISRARWYVKLVDVSAGLMLLAIGTLVFVLVAALLDHWILPSGLGVMGRLLLLMGFLAGAGAYFGTQVLPLFMKRINPVYAARQIEQARPTLKNSVINFLLFRQSSTPMHRAVYAAVEARAAGDLAQVKVESTIDRSRVIRIGYVLLGVLVLYAAYQVASPKDPLRTLSRVLLPWADIQRPTRVSFVNLEPEGDTRLYRGKTLKVSADVFGLDEDEPVHVVYTTDDQQAVDQSIAMRADGSHYTLVLGRETNGLQQSMTMHLRAGDATTRPLRVEVVPAATLEVERIEYEYPPYTGYAKRVTNDVRNIEAIEGTRVTIRGLANEPIKSAYVEMQLVGSRNLTMQVDGSRATAQLPLFYRGEDRLTSDRGTYRLRMTARSGETNPEPLEHRITVIPDQPPEASVVYPEQREVRLPVDATLPIRVQAVDRDFALHKVRLLGAVRGKLQLDETLLETPRAEPLVAEYQFSPRRLGLKDGDVLTLWVEATDNKRPKPNVTVTVWVPTQGGEQRSPRLTVMPDGAARRIIIVPSTAPQNEQDQLAKGDQPEPDDFDNPEPPKDSDGQKGNEENPDKQQKNDGQNNDGQQEKGQGQDGQGESQGGDQGQDQDSGEGQGEQKNGQGEQGQGEQGQGQKGEGQKGEGQKGEGQKGEGQKGEGQKGEGQKGEGQKGEGQKGEGQKGEGQKGEGQKGEGQKGEGQKGEGQQGKSDGGQQGQPSSGDPNADGAKSGEQNGQGEGQRRPLSSDGSDDGEAIKRLLERQQAQDSGEGQQEKRPDSQPSGDPGNAKRDPSGKTGEGEPAEGQPQPGKKDPSKKEPQGDKQGQGKSPDAKSQPGDSDDKKGEGAKTDQQGNQEEPGGQSKKGDEVGDKKEQPADSTGKGEEKAPGQGDEGNAGKGSGEQKSAGSPESQSDDPRQRPNNSGNPNPGDSQKETEAKSPSVDKRNSKSEGDESGTQKGGGKDGGGQKANQAGQDSGGSNTPADQGKGAAQEKGQGETGTKSGQDKEAQGKTGQPSDKQQSGQGSSSGKTDDQQPSGDPPPGDSKSEGGSQGEGEGESRKGKQPPGSKSGDGQHGASHGEGGADTPNDNKTTPPKTDDADEPGGDKANPEYAREATDLVLDDLRDQVDEGRVDEKLLDDLGWKRKDLQKFLKRWESMKRQAKTSKAGKEKLDEAIDSLGLRKKGAARSGKATDDKHRGLYQRRTTRPPTEYERIFRGYSRGVSGKKKE